MTDQTPETKLSEFMEALNQDIEEVQQENLTKVVEAEQIVSWEVVQVKDEDENLIAYAIFTSSSGHTTAIPLLDDNINALLGAMITQTPDLDRDTIPEMIPMHVPFMKKYKKTVIMSSILAGMFLLTGILSTQFWLAWT